MAGWSSRPGGVRGFYDYMSTQSGPGEVGPRRHGVFDFLEGFSEGVLTVLVLEDYDTYLLTRSLSFPSFPFLSFFSLYIYIFLYDFV